MAKVLEFPVKKELPKEVKECLHEIAALYVTLLDNAMNAACADITDEEEYAEMSNLMLNALIEGVIEAIGNLNES